MIILDKVESMLSESDFSKDVLSRCNIHCIIFDKMSSLTTVNFNLPKEL